MTTIPTVSTAAEAHAALARCRALVEDRVDPLVGLTLAAVADWITTSHPGVLIDDLPSTVGWPYTRLGMEAAAAAELARDLDVATRAGYTNARRDPIYADERHEADVDAQLRRYQPPAA